MTQSHSENAKEKPSTEQNEQFQYEPRLLAYLHVLGWSNLVSRSEFDRTLLRELNLVASDVEAQVSSSGFERSFFAEHAPEMASHSVLEISQFSDTLVISCPPLWPATAKLLVDVQQVCHRLLWYGHYVRGAVVLGPLAHERNVIFGPALLAASELERTVAKYPRIVVTPGAVPYLNDSFGTDLSNEKLTYLRSIRTDNDGLQYVDILGLGAGFQNQRRQPHGDEEHLVELVRNKLAAEIDDLGRVAKHTWVLSYLEQVLAECAAPETKKSG